MTINIDIAADLTTALTRKQTVNQSSHVADVHTAIVIHVANSIAMSFTMQDNGLGLAPGAPGVVGEEKRDGSFDVKI